MHVEVVPLDGSGKAWAQAMVAQHHYLHARVDPRCSVEGYAVHLNYWGPVGLLLFGRPEATRCGSFYGGVDDVSSGRCAVTRWQILNLARVWISPSFQQARPDVPYSGQFFGPEWLPGYVDRRDVFRSTLASDAIRLALARVGYDYLLRRPPVWVAQPYQIRYVISYCNTALHKGTIYQAAGFELYRTSPRRDAGGRRYLLQTWRIAVPALTEAQDLDVRHAAEQSQRSIALRARHAEPIAQLAF